LDWRPVRWGHPMSLWKPIQFIHPGGFAKVYRHHTKRAFGLQLSPFAVWAQSDGVTSYANARILSLGFWAGYPDRRSIVRHHACTGVAHERRIQGVLGAVAAGALFCRRRVDRERAHVRTRADTSTDKRVTPGRRPKPRSGVSTKPTRMRRG